MYEKTLPLFISYVLLECHLQIWALILQLDEQRQSSVFVDFFGIPCVLLEVCLHTDFLPLLIGLFDF